MFFSEKGYNVIKTLRDDGTWLDVKNEVQPDLIFFRQSIFTYKGRILYHQFSRYPHFLRSLRFCDYRQAIVTLSTGTALPGV